MLRFYFAFYVAKLSKFALKVLRRNATYFPGKIAIKLCPNFINYVVKPSNVIAVTGTNGKTTVCNLLIESFESIGKKVLNNKMGSNINAGIATSLIDGASIFNKAKFDVAVLEVDERSSLKVLPFIKPNYLICTNLFRDSIGRNANPDFIFSVISKALPKETKLILNADDLISSNLGIENEKVYFAIDKLDTDLTESINIINDMQICPRCNSKLKYNYLKYHHIGNAYCESCDYKSPEANYKITKIDYENKKITVTCNNNSYEYKMLSDSIFNTYNQIAVIATLFELGFEQEKIKEIFDKKEITETRYKKENIQGINIISHLAKGQNPIACSCVFDYMKKEKANKEVILLIYDYFDAKKSTENMVWIYDCDFEFLNSDNIDKIIIGGPRAIDFYIRLLIAGVPKEKLVYTDKTDDTANYLSLEEDKDIYILYDVYTDHIAKSVENVIKTKINEQKRGEA